MLLSANDTQALFWARGMEGAWLKIAAAAWVVKADDTGKQVRSVVTLSS